MMIRYGRPRLKIVQFVSHHTLWTLLSGSNHKASTIISVVKATLFTVCVLIAPTILFNILQDGAQSNSYPKISRNVDNQATSMDQLQLLSRIRRSSGNESDENGIFASNLRKSRSAERQTIIVVSSNKIADDDFELDIDRNKVNQSPKTQREGEDDDHERLISSTEPTTDMDTIYANTLEICESRLTSNQTNSTILDNSTKLDETEHEVCSTERESGVSALYVILYIFVVFFLFIGLAIICDDFFIASLEAISERLNLSEDVAGATFMAAGSSAPELFISVASAGTGSDVGVGTIVGSAVFNLLIIIALTASLAGKVLYLDWRPFIRDSVFYAFSIVAFILFSLDAAFKIWESLTLLLLYALYIVIMKFNTRLMEFMASWNCCFNFGSRVSPEEMQNSNGTIRSANAGNHYPLEPIEQEKSPKITPKKAVGFSDSTTQRTNSNLSVGTPVKKDTKHPDPVVRPSTADSHNNKKELMSDCLTTTNTTTNDLNIPSRETSQPITNGEKPAVVNPTMSGMTNVGVAARKMRVADTNTLQPDTSDCKQKKISNPDSSATTSRGVGSPVKSPESPRRADDHGESTRQSPFSSTPKIAFQSPSKGDRSNQSPAKELTPPDPVASCTCISSGITQPLCTCCVIHISTQPCRYCSNVTSPSPVPLMRCSSCTSILEKRLIVSDPPNPPSNGSGSQVFRAERRLPEVPIVAGIKRSASLITMQSGRGFTKLVNVNSSNNRKSKEDGDAKVADQQESFHNEGEIQLQSGATGEEPLVVVMPCLPPVSNPRPKKPESSDCLPAVKYILLFIIYVLSYPWVCIFTWTIPKCDSPENRKWYLPSFLLCIGWIAFLSWVMTVIIDKIGCLLNIDSYTMGLIVVAVGTSVPDAISSVLVAKEGHGDMAVSNAVGSNVFDINLGLGLPFFIRSIITSAPVQLMTATQMCLFENLPLPFRLIPHVKFGVILLVLLLIAVAVFIFVKFRLNKQVTVLFVSMYVAFMIYAIVQEKRCYSFFC